MGVTPPPTVFISYAHQDAGGLAQRLQRDISVEGFEVWLDLARLTGGGSWTAEIERALDGSDVVLALLSRGSFVSDTCRAEQLRSLRKGKCVIPILAQGDVDRPIHLEAKQCLNFSNDAAYRSQLPQLLNAIRRKDGAALVSQFRQTYTTIPPLPSNFVQRPRELEALRSAVVGDGSARRIALTALKGMAGIGKTVLAQALCLDEVTQAAFPDGIIWLAVGKDPRDLVPLFREAAKALGDSLEGYDSLQAASNQLRSRLREKSVLIVLDDVWDPRDAAPFLTDSARSRFLITTRDARIVVALGAHQQELDVLTWEQSRELIALWAHCATSDLPPEAGEIIVECGCLPLAIAMVGAQMRGKPDRWNNMLQKLRNADLDRIRQSFPEYPHPDLLRAIDVSMEALGDDLRTRYLAFAVFPEDCPIPEPAVRTLWGLGQYETEDATDQLVDLSLATRDGAKRLRVHDLLLDYLRRRLGTERLVDQHNELLRAYRRTCPRHWSEGPHDGYFFENLIWHLRHAQRGDEALGLLADFQWLDAKLRACGVVALLADYEWYASRDEDASLIQEALRLSAHLLATDLTQLAGQLLGRLLPGQSAAVDRLRADAEAFRGTPWLRPLRQLLPRPGGALLFTLAGHAGRVRSVALTKDGLKAVSASDDTTIKIWDLRRGTLDRTLAGHADCVRAVTVLHDGAKVVSASDDHTLRIWNLSTGTEEARIDTQLDWIRTLVAFPDAPRVASLSDDRTIKIWNLDTLTVESVLRGHSAEIGCLIMMPGGQGLISGADDRTLRLWRVDRHGSDRVLKGHCARITALAATGDRIVSVSADGAARLWSGGSQGDSHLLNWRAHGLRHAAFTPDGNSIIGAGDDNCLHLWDLRTDTERVVEGHSDWVNCIATTPNGRYAVSASDDGTLKVWDLSRVGSEAPVRDHGDRVRAVAVAFEGRAALSASDDHTLRIWDVATRSLRTVVQNHHHWVFACTPDGSRIVSSGGAGTCFVWDLESLQELHRFRIHDDRVRCLAVAPCGSRVVSGADDATIRVWDIQSGQEQACIRLERQWPRAVAIMPDSRCAITAAESTSLKLWDLERGDDLRTFRGHTARVNAVAVSRDGRWMASGSDDHTLRVWEVGSGSPITTMRGHHAKVNALSFLPGDKLVVSASDDGDLRVWDVMGGVAVACLSIETPLLTCAVAPRTGELIAGDRLGLVHFVALEAIQAQALV